jgi:ABC-type antimicrobial peptide transport system permease subunit
VIAAARAVNPAILVNLRSLDDQIQSSLVTERLMAMLSGFFGVLAGILAAIGLYGVMSYMVAQRRQEIGIRMALGADRGRVLLLIGREAGGLVIVGAVIGVSMAAFAVKYANTLLFGLEPRDPMTFAIAVGILVAVALVATFLPAFRAARLEPTTALRDS